MKDWIIVISSKIGYQLLSCLSSEKIIIHLTENFLSGIVRYKCKGYTQLFVRARLEKKKKEKKKRQNVMGFREDKSP